MIQMYIEREPNRNKLVRQGFPIGKINISEGELNYH
jgi:hypothetical protein